MGGGGRGDGSLASGVSSAGKRMPLIRCRNIVWKCITRKYYNVVTASSYENCTTNCFHLNKERHGLGDYQFVSRCRGVNAQVLDIHFLKVQRKNCFRIKEFDFRFKFKYFRSKSFIVIVTIIDLPITYVYENIEKI